MDRGVAGHRFIMSTPAEAPDQYTMRDPSKMYADRVPDEQYLPGPGTDAEMAQNVPADHGEESYRGSGRLTGRKALVTGGDSGIGAAVAIAFAREGADVVISFLPEEQEDADRILALVRDAGRTGVGVAGDLADAAFARQLVDTAVQELGGLDILVNNAGKQQHVEDVTDISDDEFDQTFKTNVYATFWLTKAAVPHMPPGSTIINSTSIQAYAPSPHLVHYAATKATVNNLAKGLAAQLAPKGIRVNAVAPGPIWTPLQPAGGQPPEALPSAGEQTYLGRWGQPAELAPAYVFLASGESSYVVGETLHVDGGMPTP